MKLNKEHICSLTITGSVIAGITLMIGQFTSDCFEIGSILTGTSIGIGITYSCILGIKQYKKSYNSENDKLIK